MYGWGTSSEALVSVSANYFEPLSLFSEIEDATNTEVIRNDAN